MDRRRNILIIGTHKLSSVAIQLEGRLLSRLLLIN
jgi:hypothetical protein